jgi:UDP-N-acetylglucosamine--N-acetylmuramyl-(pentapeptide) pyrophosphoryl-undecaprenol N-acetylglucosamine transferase
LVDAGAGVAVADADCTVETIEPVVGRLLADPDRRQAMADAARTVGRPDAAARVCAVIEERARDAA